MYSSSSYFQQFSSSTASKSSESVVATSDMYQCPQSAKCYYLKRVYLLPLLALSSAFWYTEPITPNVVALQIIIHWVKLHWHNFTSVILVFLFHYLWFVVFGWHRGSTPQWLSANVIFHSVICIVSFFHLCPIPSVSTLLDQEIYSGYPSFHLISFPQEMYQYHTSRKRAPRWLRVTSHKRSTTRTNLDGCRLQFRSILRDSCTNFTCDVLRKLVSNNSPYFFSVHREKLLYNVETEENYNLLEDIWETLNDYCGKSNQIFKSLIIYDVSQMTLLVVGY